MYGVQRERVLYEATKHLVLRPFVNNSLSQILVKPVAPIARLEKAPGAGSFRRGDGSRRSSCPALLVAPPTAWIRQRFARQRLVPAARSHLAAPPGERLPSTAPRPLSEPNLPVFAACGRRATRDGGGQLLRGPRDHHRSPAQRRKMPLAHEAARLGHVTSTQTDARIW